jgi:hypothetical protein
MPLKSPENLENPLPENSENNLSKSLERATDVSKSKDQREDDLFGKALEWTVKLYKPEEFRSNVKLWGSGILALSLWILLGTLAWSHFEASRQFAFKISTLSPKLEDGKISLVHQQEVQLIEKANTLVDSTSNRLYTFLTPIVTAITGYFFVASAASRTQGGQGSSGLGGGTSN